MPAKRAVPRKAAAKPVAAAATAARASATAMQERIAKLEYQVQNFIWCWAERDWKMQVAAINQMLANPQARERLAQQLVAQAQAKANNGVPVLTK
jgi:hypothetical protein